MSARHTPAIALAAVLAAAGFSHAAIIEVPGDQPTIQAGVVASSPGDTVLVAPGAYFEEVNFGGRAITVASRYLTTGDPAYVDSTAITGNWTIGPLVTFAASEDSLSVLCGFTVRYGIGSSGAGVFCNGSSPRIRDCQFLYNTSAYNGGGVYAFQGSPIVECCRFEGNESTSRSGGGLAVEYGSPRVTGCTFTGNSAHETSGAAFFESSSPVITDCVIDGNSSAVTYAGGIMSRDCTSVIARNVFSNNETYGTGGGLFY